MKTLLELQPLIVEWATNKNIHLPECAPKQRLKLIEEVGELASAILKEDIDKQKDAVGDIFVVLVILAEQIKANYDFNFYPSKNNLLYQLKQILFSDISTSFDFLNDTCRLLNLDFTECANLAWNEIKDRQGVTKNGTFIKN